MDQKANTPGDISESKGEKTKENRDDLKDRYEIQC